MLAADTRHDIRINRCGSIHFEPDWYWSPTPQSLVDFDLLFFWTGEGRAVYDGEEIRLAQGTTICLHPGASYHSVHNPQNRLGVCYIHFDFIDGAGTIVHPHPEQLPPRWHRVADAGFFEQTARRILKHADGDVTHRIAAKHLLWAMLLMMHDECTQHVDDGLDAECRARLADVAHHILENPSQDISVPALARLANYSPDHFSRLFRRLHGVGPKEFCIRARIDRARDLLINTNLTIGQIAVNLGYPDIFFFSRQFKSRVGYTPSAWRNIHRW